VTSLPADLAGRIEKLVGPGGLRLDSETIRRYGGDWTRVHEPRPSAVVLPADVDAVRGLVRLAAAERLALVPSGGRTGLSGGALAARGELVVALDRLDWIDEVNPVDRTLTCGAGVITARVQEAAAAAGLFYPVDFASSGSSQIGGNVATNAGGIKVIRYGMTRDWIAGVKLVTGTGELLDLNRGLVKNNTGYDLRHLVVGSEGTLGIVVEVTVSLARPPADPVVAVLGVPDMASIMELLARFQEVLLPSAFEFFSEQALDKVVNHGGLRRPFEGPACACYALVEFEQTIGGERENALAVLQQALQDGLVLNGVMSESLGQARDLWRLREDISETISRWTPYKNDLSVRVSRVPDFVAEIDGLVSDACPDLEVVWYGHIGDGNVHLNILKPDSLPMATFQSRCRELSSEIYAVVARFDGSISAEHGVGLLKKDFLEFSRSPPEIELMRQIKRVFDPHGIMNPGKLLDG
jgi:FAD/FMN-containing dehydrogenase